MRDQIAAALAEYDAKIAALSMDVQFAQKRELALLAFHDRIQAVLSMNPINPMNPIARHTVGAADDCAPDSRGCCGCTVTARCTGCPYTGLER